MRQSTTKCAVLLNYLTLHDDATRPPRWETAAHQRSCQPQLPDFKPAIF
jgi:hypothetical protein